MRIEFGSSGNHMVDGADAEDRKDRKRREGDCPLCDCPKTSESRKCAHCGDAGVTEKVKCHDCGEGTVPVHVCEDCGHTWE